MSTLLPSPCKKIGAGKHVSHCTCTYTSATAYLLPVNQHIIDYGCSDTEWYQWPLYSYTCVTFFLVYMRPGDYCLPHTAFVSLSLNFRVRDIGVWFDVIQGMVLLAILTNCFILGFSSEQLMQWLPWLYSRDMESGGDQIMAVGSGRSGSCCVYLNLRSTLV